jgi:hypothetical protein
MGRGLVLYKIIRPELVKEILFRVLLKSLRTVEAVRQRTLWITDTHFHVMENSIAKRHKVAMIRVQDIHGAPSVAPHESSPGELRDIGIGGRGILTNEFVS